MIFWGLAMDYKKIISKFVVLMLLLCISGISDDLGVQSASDEIDTTISCPQGKESLLVCDENVCITPHCEINDDCVGKIDCGTGKNAVCITERCGCIDSMDLNSNETLPEDQDFGDEEIPSPLGLECHSQDYTSEDLKDYYDKTAQQLCSVSDAFKEFLGTPPENVSEQYTFTEPPFRTPFPGVLTTVEDGIGRAISEVVYEESRLSDNMIRFIEVSNMMLHLCGLADYVCGHECHLCNVAAEGVDECACKDRTCCQALQTEELCGISDTCIWTAATENECAGKESGSSCYDGNGLCCEVKEGEEMISKCFMGASACGTPGEEPDAGQEGEDCCAGKENGDSCGLGDTDAGICVEGICIAEGTTIIQQNTDGQAFTVDQEILDALNVEEWNEAEQPVVNTIIEIIEGGDWTGQASDVTTAIALEIQNQNWTADEQVIVSQIITNIVSIAQQDVTDNAGSCANARDNTGCNGGNGVCCSGLCVDDAMSCTDACPAIASSDCSGAPDETRCGKAGICCGETCIEGTFSCKVGTCDLACDQFDGAICGDMDCSQYSKDQCGVANETQGICMWQETDSVKGDDDNDGDGVLRCYNILTCDSDGDRIADRDDPDDDNDGIPDEEDDDIDGDGVLNENDIRLGDDNDISGRKMYGVSYPSDITTIECINECTHKCVWESECRDTELNTCINDCECPDSSGKAFTIIDRVDMPSEEELDFDGDGILRCNNTDTCDSDGDGRIDIEDPDDDNDGVLDGDDDDADGDGNPNAYDMLPGDDDDFTFGQGWYTDDDLDCSLTCGPGDENCDSDGDGIPDSDDADADDDGTLNNNDTDPDGDTIEVGCKNVCNFNKTSDECKPACPMNWADGKDQCSMWSGQCVETINRYYDNLYLLEKLGILITENVKNILEFSQEEALLHIQDDGAVVAANATSLLDLRVLTPGLLKANEMLEGKEIETDLKFYVADVVRAFIGGKAALEGNATLVEQGLEELDSGIEENRDKVMANLDNLAQRNCDLSEALQCVEGQNTRDKPPIDEFADKEFWKQFKEVLENAFTDYINEKSLDYNVDVLSEGGKRILKSTHRNVENERISFVPAVDTLPDNFTVSVILKENENTTQENIEGVLVFPAEENSSITLESAGVSIWQNKLSIRIDWTSGTCEGCIIEVSFDESVAGPIWWVSDLGTLETTVKGYPEQVREERARQWARDTTIADVNGNRNIMLSEPEAFTSFMSTIFGHACLLAESNAEKLIDTPDEWQADLYDVTSPFDELSLLPERESDILGQLFVSWSEGTSLPDLVTFGDPIISEEDNQRATTAVEKTKEMLQHMCIQNINRGTYDTILEEEEPVQALTDTVWEYKCSEIKNEADCGIGESETYCRWNEELGICENIITYDALHILPLSDVHPEDQTDQCEESSIVCSDFRLNDYDTATYVSPTCVVSIMVKLGLTDEMCTNLEGLETLMLEQNCTKGAVLNCFESELGTPEITKPNGKIWLVNCGDMLLPEEVQEHQDESIPLCDTYEVNVVKEPDVNIINGGQEVEFQVTVTDTSTLETCRQREVSIWSDAPIKDDNAVCAITFSPVRGEKQFLRKGESITGTVRVASFYKSGNCSVIIHVEDGGEVKKEFNLEVNYEDSGPIVCDEGEYFDPDTQVCCPEGEMCCKDTSDCFNAGICVDNRFIPSLCGQDHYCIDDMDVSHVQLCEDEGLICNPEGTRCVHPKDINIQFNINVITPLEDDYPIDSELQLVVDVVDKDGRHIMDADVSVEITDTKNIVILEEHKETENYIGKVHFGEKIGNYKMIVKAKKYKSEEIFEKELSLYDKLLFTYEAKPLALFAGGSISISDLSVKDGSGNVLDNVDVKSYIGDTEVEIIDDQISLPVLTPGTHTLKLCAKKTFYKPDISCISMNGYCCKAAGLEILSNDGLTLSLSDSDMKKYAVGEVIVFRVSHPTGVGDAMCSNGEEEQTCTLVDGTCEISFKATKVMDMAVQCNVMGEIVQESIAIFDKIVNVELSKTVDIAQPNEEIEVISASNSLGLLNDFDVYWMVDDEVIPSRKLTMPTSIGNHEITLTVGATNHIEYVNKWNVNVDAIYDFETSLHPQVQTIKPGTEAEYVVLLKNTGNSEQTFSIVSEDFTISTDKVVLGVGEEKEITVLTTGLEGVKTNTLQIIGTKDTKTVSGQIIVSTEDQKGVELKTFQDSEEIEIGQGSVLVGYEIWNTGNVQDTYVVSTSGINLGNERITVDSNGNVRKEYPMTFSSPGEYTITFSAVSENDATITDEVSVSVLIYSYGFEISKESIKIEDVLGARKDFSFELKNIGIKPDAFSISSKSKELTLLTGFVTLEPGESKMIYGKTTLKYDAVSKIIIESQSTKTKQTLDVISELIASFKLSVDTASVAVARGNSVEFKVVLENTVQTPLNLHLKLSLPKGREALFDWTEQDVSLAANEIKELTVKVTAGADAILGEFSLTVVGKSGKETKSKSMTVNVVADINALKADIDTIDQEIRLVEKELSDLSKQDIEAVSASVALQSTKIDINELKKDFENGNYDAVKQKIEKAQLALDRTKSELNSAKKLSGVGMFKSTSTMPVLALLVLVSLLVAVVLKKRK